MPHGEVVHPAPQAPVGDQPQRWASGRPRPSDPHQAPHQPVVPIVETILPPPDLAGPPVPLALAGRIPTHVLTTARSRIAKKPPPTDPATASSLHAVVLGHTARASAIPSRPACGERRDQPCVCSNTGRTTSGATTQNSLPDNGRDWRQDSARAGALTHAPSSIRAPSRAGTSRSGRCCAWVATVWRGGRRGVRTGTSLDPARGARAETPLMRPMVTRRGPSASRPGPSPR
jgi:hypothetical protein